MEIKELFNTMPQTGTIEWISKRPQRRGSIETALKIEVTPEEGIIGDHYAGSSGKRQVTLIQAEHLQTVASILGLKNLDPKLTRRNIIVKGINLLALKDCQFQIGEEVILEMTGLCHPCTRMEENFGPGGYNAMRGHGGITCKVIQGGTINTDDTVRLIKHMEEKS